MRSGMKWLAMGSLGLALCTGCSGAEAEQAAPGETETPVNTTTEASVVLRIEVEPGHTVTFYEPVPGALYLAEHKLPTQSFMLGDKESANALLAFERLLPGAPVPAELQAAYGRALNLPSDVDEQESSAGGGDREDASARAQRPGVTEQALTSSSSAATFVNNGGCNWGPRWSTCAVNWANGYYAYSTSTSGLCGVDHYSGNGVIIQITVGSTITSVFQGAGTHAQYSLGSAGVSTTRRLDITNASGDSFHVGCRWGI
ncbi:MULTISPECIES: hypothetical protein [Myxococcus]|uniref:hypothetical protein n=1 Tax=Myxococcus TaxID=32 RepID=UPI001142CE6C|nr:MULTISPECIES: hypothetical protein [Myxococcus]NOK05912.1 hypothetical protein [Myxococcus xanthus]